MVEQQQQPAVMQAHQQLHWLQPQEEQGPPPQQLLLQQAPPQQRVLCLEWEQQPWQQVLLLPLEPRPSLLEPAVVALLVRALAAATGLCQALNRTSRPPLCTPPLPSLIST